MNILNKFKETVISVFPVMAIVLLLGLTVVPLDKFLLIRFVIGGLFLILGLTIFLLGVDLGIQPMGERCGAELTKKRNLVLLLSAAFIIGFIVTAAEPDIQVFGDQVKSVYSYVNKTVLTFVMAAGVGVFIMLGLFRTVFNLSLKLTLFISYAIVFAIVIFTPESFIGIAFDSGGSTTGPMTVPFILALGLGVASVRSSSDGDSSFGLTGVASVGPVMAVLLYAIYLKVAMAGGGITADAGVIENSSEGIVKFVLDDVVVTKEVSTFAKIFNPFREVWNAVLNESLVSILPLFGLFVVFQITLLKMTARQVTRIVIGFMYAFVGLSVFLTGVNGGFMQAGRELGVILGTNATEIGGGWYVLLICTGLVLGAIIVCAEPAVWVLSEQVEQVSGGTIKRKALLAFLSVGTAIAIGISMWRAVAGFSLRWILIPGYTIAMVLMFFAPSIFSGIAFDSGGVASGPLTSTFVLSFTIGASSCGSGNTDSFGVIALVAMMPLIAIQLMGIIFNKKINRSEVQNGGGENA